MFLPLLLAACGLTERPDEARPHVLFVTVSGVRPDRLGAWGGAGPSPTFDALAAEGARFDELIATAAVPLVAQGSVFSGLLPPTHGVRDPGASFHDGLHLLPERLAEAGYATAAFVSDPGLGRSFHLDQGFAAWDEPAALRPTADTAAAARAWIDGWKPQKPGDTFFLWAQLGGGPALTADGYPAAQASIDAGLSAILAGLDARGLADRTLVVVAGDVAEALGDRGELGRGWFVYRSTVHVPMIWRWPGKIPAGTVVTEPVSGVDVAPTLLAALGLPTKLLQGRDVNPAFFHAEIKFAPVYSEAWTAPAGLDVAPVVALRESGFAYLRAPAPELYHLAQDPGETKDLAAEAPDRARAMDAALGKLLDSAAAKAQPAGPPPPAVPTGPWGSGAGDRKASTATYARFQAALATGTGLEALVAEAPGFVAAWNALGQARLAAGDAAGATEAFRRSLAILPDQPWVTAALPAPPTP